MRVLVTGASGFIGSHVVEALTSRGHEVVAIDIAPYSNPPEGVQFLRLDIRDHLRLHNVIGKVSSIVHLAALINAYESIKVPDLYHDVNVNGTLSLLKFSQDLRVEKFVFASSAAVYGEPQYLPIDEKHPLRPLNPYGATKVACEAYISAFHFTYDIPAIILRIFNAYGPRQTGAYAGVISKFIKRALSGESLIIYGDGEQTRDFIYVDDVVGAIVEALESDLNFGIFNIGTGKATSINELAELIRKLTNRNVPVIHEKERPGDIRHSHASIKAAEKVLKWAPKIELEEGLRITIRWYKEQLAL